MKHLIITFFISAILEVGLLGAQSPGGVDGLSAWWSTTQEAGNGQWQDHINRSTLPVLCKSSQTLINFNQAFNFCSETEMSPSFLSETALTIIAVAFPKSSNEQTIWSLSHADSSQYVLTNHRMADLSERAYMNFQENSRHQPFLYTYLGEKKVMELEDYHGLFEIGQQHRSDIPTASFDGAIPELLIYNHVLTAADRNKVESALAIKYGLSISSFQSPNYLSSDDQVIWDGIKDKVFSHHIAGVGRDDRSDLFQKQSKSSTDDSMLTIAMNKKANSNHENKSEVADLSFLIWGNNNGAMKFIDNGGVVIPLEKEWRINNTNFDAQISTAVYFDLLKLNTYIANDESLYMIIDRSGSGNYHANDCEYVLLKNKDGAAQCNNILWDTDGSGKDQFRLAIAPQFFGKYSVDEASCGSDEKAKLFVGAEGGLPPYQFTLSNQKGNDIQWKNQGNSVELIEGLEPGIYTYSIEDANGQKFSSLITIANTTTNRYKIPSELIISENDVISFNPASYGVTDYELISPDGVRSNAPIFISTSGVYTLLVVEDNCTTAYEIEFSRLTRTPIIQFQAYPNPTINGQFSVTIKCDAPSNVTYQLTSMDGKIIHQTHLTGRSIYNLRGRLPSKGHYIISAKIEEHETSSPLIYQ